MSPPPGRVSGRGSRQASSVLYVTYDGLLEPLGASQVLPYVRGVRAAGHTVTVLSFEKAEDLARPGRVEALERDLAGSDIGWRRLRYHRRPSLPATAWDVVQGSRAVRRWSREGRGRRVVHARGYLPGLMGTSAADPEVRLLFDMRGFWVDERVEGGYWTPAGLPARLGRAVERRALEAADHLILLTRRGVERVGDLLPAAEALPATVIPTCVDTRRFHPPEDPAAARRRLGLGGGPVLVHVGTLTGWYDGAATLAVARAFLERTGGRFVILTRDMARAGALVAEAGLEATVRTVPPEEVPGWLAAADAGLALVRTLPSKDASYPTKIGEYLATGLAVLATPIGDMAALAERDGREVVDLLTEGGEPVDAAHWLADASARPGRVARARALAKEELSLEEGVRRLLGVYRSLGLEPGTSP